MASCVLTYNSCKCQRGHSGRRTGIAQIQCLWKFVEQDRIQLCRSCKWLHLHRGCPGEFGEADTAKPADLIPYALDFGRLTLNDDYLQAIVVIHVDVG